MKAPDVSKSPLTTEPLFSLTLDKLEPVFKSWVRDVLGEEKSPVSELIFYSRYEVCKLLKISLPTLGRYMKLGIVTGKRVGNRILFSQDDLDKALHEINRS